MHDHPSETLRSKDATRDGRHLHAPDGFPHSMMGILFAFAILIPLIVGAFYALAGIGGALIGGGLFLFVGFPLMIGKLMRGTRHWRVVDELEEIETEHAEERGEVPPTNSIEKINERLNRSRYNESVPRTHPPH